jgi:acetyl-CoA synthase
VAGRELQEDFEPILERQIHHLINYIQGIMHIGQRDIAWVRVSKAAVEKGFTLKDIGVVLHAKFHQDFGNPGQGSGHPLHQEGRCGQDDREGQGRVQDRDERVEKMTDEDVETFYSCTLCQSFAPSHVCTVSPERTGLCGAYNWMDCKASYEINPTGPNQPIEKGECWIRCWASGKASTSSLQGLPRRHHHYNFYSMVNDPMTTCGCCECIAAMLPGLQRRHDRQPRLHRRNPLRHEVHHPGRCHGRRRVFTGFCGPLQVQHHPAQSSSRATAACCAWSGCPRSSRKRSKNVWRSGEEMGVCPDSMT